jgi:hypothetical protein
MTKFKKKLEIDLLKAMTYTEINNLLTKLNRQIECLQKKVNQGQKLPIAGVVGRSEQLLAFAKHLLPKEEVSLLMNEVNVFIDESK